MNLEKLSQKITVSIVGVTLTFTFFFGIASFWYSRTIIFEQISHGMDHDVNEFRARFESYLTDLDYDIENMSRNLLLSNALVDSMGRELYVTPFLQGYSTPMDVPFRLTLLDFEGKVIAPLQQTEIERPYLEELIATTVSRHLPYASVSQREGTCYLNLAFPVFYGATGMAEGALAMEISLSELFSQIVQDEQIKAHSLLSIKQGAKSVISAGAKSEDNFYFVNKPLSLPSNLQRLQLSIEYGQSLDQALAPLNKITFVYIICAIFILLATTFISRVIAKKIANPIISLSQVANQVAETGLPSASINIEETGEVGILAKSFEKMLVRLYDARNHLEMLVDERTKELTAEIAERAKTEEALKAAKEEWEETFDAMSDIITIQGKDMRIVRANKAAYKAFQAEPGGLNNRYCYEVFRGADTPCANCPELSTLKEKTTFSEDITHENLGKIFNVTSSPVLNGHNEITHLVHIAKDITEHKKMENELLQAHKMEAVGTLAGGIAHDFNNILAAILGYADMAKDDIPAWNPSRNYLEQVLKAGNRAKELVQQILTFSRKSGERQHPFQPASIIKEGLKLMRASLPTTIEIQEEINDDCGSILANPTNIHQVLVNLCTNALHAMEDEKGVLTVKLRRVELEGHAVALEAGVSPGAFIELMVSDTGCGMDKKKVERIFEPYYTTKEVGKGSGMGLALVHGIVEGCRGFIKVESKPGEGTTFHVYFPVTEEEVEMAKEEKQNTLPGGDERIMAVDDEESIAGMYKVTLEKLGYKVTAHCSSEKSLEAFRMSPDSFDLIITDQTMPNLSGSELAKKVLQIRPNIPIILCTGYSTMISEKMAEEVGIEKFVMKPVSRSDLALIVREVLDKRKSTAA